jgi:hypothetical protein
MAQLSLSAVALPSACAGLGNIIPAAQDSLYANGGVFAFADGSSGSDVVTSAELLSSLDASGLLYALFNTSFSDISGGDSAAVQAQKAFAVLGGELAVSNLGIASAASAISIACASGSKPTLALTTTGVAGYFRIRLLSAIAA